MTKLTDAFYSGWSSWPGGDRDRYRKVTEMLTEAVASTGRFVSLPNEAQLAAEAAEALVDVTVLFHRPASVKEKNSSLVARKE